MDERKGGCRPLCKGLKRASEMNHGTSLFFFFFNFLRAGLLCCRSLVLLPTAGSIDTFISPFSSSFVIPQVAPAEDTV